MARWVWIALAGIIVLGGGSALLIAVASGPAIASAPQETLLPLRPSAARVAAPAAVTSRAADAPDAPAAAPSVATSPAAAADPVWERQEAPPSSGAWNTIAIANRFPALGRIGSSVRTGLAELKERRLDACLEGPAYDPNLARVAAEEGGAAEDTTPVLVLQLETLDGLVRIADVAVERRGSASASVLACAARELRGSSLAVPEARAGSRHRLRYRLAQ